MMTRSNWRHIARSFPTQLKILKALRDRGFQGLSWINGCLVGYAEVDEARVLEIARGAIGSPERPPSGETSKATVPQDPRKKHPGGRPKGSKNKPKE